MSGAAANGAAPEIAAKRQASTVPLVVHVIHRLGVGGLENGLVNLVNRMPADRYRHAIVCMTDYTDFRERITRDDVPVYAMHRGRASLMRTYFDLFRLFRTLKPVIVHTRNLSGLDALLPALLAGVPVRIHGEHGRDMDDLDGSNRRYRYLKRMFRPLVTHYTAVSVDLANYLCDRIGVPRGRVQQIYNGVDTARFRPAPRPSPSADACGKPFVIGTVGRLQPVKDQVSLVRAFAAAIEYAPAVLGAAKLIIAGEGPERPVIDRAIADTSLGNRVELLGARDDIPELLRSMDLFVLPSLAEGISNTILEAMATGLPVIATRVGGNAELVRDGETGVLVDAGDWRAMARHIVAYASDPLRRARHGRKARERVERQFSLEAMVESYAMLYDTLTESVRRASVRKVFLSSS